MTKNQRNRNAGESFSLLGWIKGKFIKTSENKEVFESPESSAKADNGILDISQNSQVSTLKGDTAAYRIVANGCTQLTIIEPSISCNELLLQNTAIRTLPEQITVKFKLDLQNCSELVSLPKGLKTGSLNLNNCSKLECLPEDCSVTFLDMENCTGVTELPTTLSVRGGRLNVRNCVNIRSLPSGLGPIAQLNLSGCEFIKQLPDDLIVTSWIDLAGTAIDRLPEHLSHTQLRWRGVAIDQRIAFKPDEITSEEILSQSNLELRRVMLERVGFERFFKEIDPEVLDQDTDPGGERKLYRVLLERDEDLVCVSLKCPSTGRRYVLRVPPTMKTCKEAAAWLAGYDDPQQFIPILET